MKIPYGRQDINQEDIDAVIKVLKSDFLTQGPEILNFEKNIASKVGAKYASAVCNATSALHLALAALDIKKGDLVWTSSTSFVASSNCALYLGADVDFVDIDSDTFNMTPKSLQSKIQEYLDSGKTLPKAIIPVHMAGQSCQMKEISEIVKPHNIKIIEDASHAIGGKYRDQMVGSCEYSDMAVFSFHPVKIVTTAEGGMITTNNEEWYRKIMDLRTHGITRDPNKLNRTNMGSWYYEQLELGYNYRITDMQAALGNSQLNRLDDFIKRRHQIAEKYDKGINSKFIKTPIRLEETYSAFHLYIIQLNENCTQSHTEAYNYLRENGVLVNLHYYPIHMQPYYQNLGFKEGLCPNSEAYYKKSISIPMFPTIKEEEIEYVIEKINSIH